MSAPAIAGGNFGHIELSGSAQRNLRLTVGSELPDQSEAAALFGKAVAY
jgi:hypothetical protein